MNSKTYIQVILPLKLDWEPFYSVPGGLSLVPGDRVRLVFSSREYIAVVSKTDAEPDEELINIDSILEVLSKEDTLPPVSPEELEFWRKLAGYYMCTVGEVYKSVYSRDQKPPKKWVAGKDRSSVQMVPTLDTAGKKAYEGILDAFKLPKTVLLDSSAQQDSTELYLSLAINSIKQGKSVLYLVPEIALTAKLEEKVRSVFPDTIINHSKLTSAKRRDAALCAREGLPIVVLGTRSSLFLPFSNLGLVIVDQEHDTSYKQDAPAPRYNAREFAIMLAARFGANVILGSATPSLESLYNSEIGIFTRIELKQHFSTAKIPSISIINSISEKRKHGMVDNLSLKIIQEIKDVLESGEMVLAVCRSKYVIDDYKAEFANVFPDAPEGSIECSSPAGVKNINAAQYGLVVVLEADRMLAKEDFRCDERAIQLLQRLASSCGKLVVQTKDPDHRVFKSLGNGSEYPYAVMLTERKVNDYPPYTRLVDIVVKDNDDSRITLRSRLLGNRLRDSLEFFGEPKILGPYDSTAENPEGSNQRTLRIILKRDKTLSGCKRAIYKSVTEFEELYSYSGHITIDVDPV